MPAENYQALPSEAIEAAAARWLAESEEGLTPAQTAEFERWRRADPGHEAAMVRLQEACGILKRMPALPEELKSRLAAAEASAPAGRNLAGSAWILAAVAACLALAAVGWRIWPRKRNVPQAYVQTYTTTGGGYQRVNLPDGSVIELNSSSEARVEFTQAERRVTLVAGEAQFNVARNPRRPFIVKAGQVSVRAVGTAFQIRMEHAAVEVVVTEGKVQVGSEGDRSVAPKGDAPGSGGNDFVPSSLLVTAGFRVTYSTDGRSAVVPMVEKVDEPAIRESLAWQAPRLVFVDTPLADVVAQFNRHNRLQITLGDASLMARRVGGNFRADNVETFVSLLERSRDIVVERPGPDRIILHRAR